jgi:excisionase family DNA binding protein
MLKRSKDCLMTKPNDDLCSTREAAQLLGISLRTAQLWVESGALRAWKTEGGHRRILRSSVEELLEQRRRAVSTEKSPGGFRIVVVEDEPDLAKLYRLTIEGWGLPVRVVTAANGFEGLIRIGEERPDLLISDLNMPGMDGFRMIRMLRGNPEFRKMGIVVATALGPAEIADRGGLPADVKVFTKPLAFSDLEALVREKAARRGGAR